MNRRFFIASALVFVAWMLGSPSSPGYTAPRCGPDGGMTGGL